MTKNLPIILSKETQAEILDYFKTKKDNRIDIIAEHFGISPNYVHTIVDKHFKLMFARNKPYNEEIS